MSERREWWLLFHPRKQVVLLHQPYRLDEDDQHTQVHVREVLPGDLGMLNGYEPLVNKLESLEERHAKLVEKHKKLWKAARTVAESGMASSDGRWCSVPDIEICELEMITGKPIEAALEAEVGDE